MSAPFPLDRAHLLVQVSFPVSRHPTKETLLADVEALADELGGCAHQRTEPAPSKRGQPGFDTFSCVVAFEAGEGQAERFAAATERKFRRLGAVVHLDLECVYGPEDEEEVSSAVRPR